MSFVNTFVEKSRFKIKNIIFTTNYAINYFKKNNPFLIVFRDITENIKSLFSANKKLKIAKSRVNQLRNRVNQLENIINSNNPYNYGSGAKINKLR